MKKRITMTALAICAISGGASAKEFNAAQIQTIQSLMIASLAGGDNRCPRFHMIEREMKEDAAASGLSEDDTHSEDFDKIWKAAAAGAVTSFEEDPSGFCDEAWKLLGPAGLYRRQLLEANGSRDTVPQKLPQEVPQKLPHEVISFTANELFDAYDRNEVATDISLKGKIVEVSGRVQSVKKDEFESVYVDLVPSNQWSGVCFWCHRSAAMHVYKSEEADVAALQKGQLVVFRCLKMRRLAGSPSGSDCLLMKTQ